MAKSTCLVDIRGTANIKRKVASKRWAAIAARAIWKTLVRRLSHQARRSLLVKVRLKMGRLE
jgi:hypothetical protein